MRKSLTYALLFLALIPSASTWTIAGEFWSNQRPANVVLGYGDFETVTFPSPSASGFGSPNDVAVDPASGKVFVAEGMNRILRFASAAAARTGSAGEAALGQTDLTSFGDGTSQSQLSTPTGICIDHTGTLWVADHINSRVLRFDKAASKATGANADGVLGQADFTSDEENRGGSPGPGTLARPNDVFVDASGTLWVSDSNNHRILRFDNAASQANGADANGVLGQANFSTNSLGLAANRLTYPAGLTVSASGTLYVADQGNNRIGRFDEAAGKPNGANADDFLGQPNPTTNAAGLDQNSLNGPNSVAIDSCGDLWVTDFVNHRVLLFRDPEMKPTGGPADHVLGQPDFETDTAATRQDGLTLPSGLTFDTRGRLWVADTGNNRVLRFSPGNFQPDNSVGKKAPSKIGNDLYNATGAGQKVTGKSKKLRKLTFHATVQNDGPNADLFSVSGTRKNRYFKVTYFDVSAGKTNITSAVISGIQTFTEVATEAARNLEIQVKPKRKARDKKKSRVFRLTSISNANGTLDTVHAKAKTKK